MTAGCEHVWQVVHTWRVRYRLDLVCVRCYETWPVPGRWWSRKAMTAKGHEVQAWLHEGRLYRLRRLQ